MTEFPEDLTEVLALFEASPGNRFWQVAFREGGRWFSTSYTEIGTHATAYDCIRWQPLPPLQ